MIIDVAVGEFFRNLGGESFAVRLLYSFAVVEGYHLVLVALHLFDELQGGFADVVALGENLFGVETYDVALFELEAVHGGVARSVSYLTGRHAVDRVNHVGFIFFHTDVGIEGERRRKTLGNALCGYYVYRAVGDEPLCLLRREDYIRVVGEDEDVCRVYLLNGVGYVRSRRVHGLTAFDYPVYR